MADLLAVKITGSRAGKGVFVTTDHDEAVGEVQRMTLALKPGERFTVENLGENSPPNDGSPPHAH